ncbi:hypothetical protein EMPS_08978 [Entomortierella parvispora]|uniref:Uncharacterized protein n=1 Tax=Entomortierella parvispora TaxID=205924 RepID=A0A9P3HH41_9FUNG|nr:hypothetical protein EMPS_08978 [Entomortierella parvispora]
MAFGSSFAARLFAKVKQQLLPLNDQIPPSIHPVLNSPQVQKDAFPMAMANDPHGAMYQQDLNAVYHIQQFEVPVLQAEPSVALMHMQRQNQQYQQQQLQQQQQQSDQQLNTLCSNPTESDPPGLGIELSKRLSDHLHPLQDKNGDGGELHHQSILSSNGQERRVPRPQSIGTLNTQHSATTTTSLQHSHSLNHLPDRPKPERLRDYSKVFPLVRSRTGSVPEHLQGRNSPFARSRDTLQGSNNSVNVSPAVMQSGSNSGPFSPTVTTPTTPLSRGEIGYMGNQTLKAFHTIPRSASMGYIAAVNNMNANNAVVSSVASSSGSNSIQGSPIFNNGGSFDDTTTPNSLRSYRSMSSFFGQQGRRQSQSDALAAEKSLDEHLKAIRRRSFAAEVMNSPGGALSPTCIDITLSQELVDADQTLEGFEGNSGSPRSVAPSRGKGNFRMSFSSPNMGTLQRRSSLALKSVLNSIVSSPVVSSSSSVISSSSSGSSGPSSPQHQSELPPPSAQDLLRAEYGSIYTDVMQQLSSSSVGAEQGLTMIQDLDDRLQPYAASGGSDESAAAAAATAHQQSLLQSSAPSVSSSATPQRRSRSGSVSSAWTARTSSSGSSDSNNSTHSNLTSLSNEDRRNSVNGNNNPTLKPPGPPPTVMNRVLNKYQHHHNPRPMLSLLRRGSSSGRIHTADLGDAKNKRGGTRSGNTTPVSKKFPYQGDLSSYSWDYRRDLPTN